MKTDVASVSLRLSLCLGSCLWSFLGCSQMLHSCAQSCPGFLRYSGLLKQMLCVCFCALLPGSRLQVLLLRVNRTEFSGGTHLVFGFVLWLKKMLKKREMWS